MAVLSVTKAGPAVLLALVMMAVTLWVYWPGITGPELLDDRSSILVIADLQDRPELALDYVFGDRSGLLGRSVSMASFVLEKLYLNEGIVGSKKVNIVLHVLNGGLIIWLFWLLFRFLSVPGYRWLAVLLGSTWLLHPLLVSTVLYIVQRMAMLSTFFMLLAAISYVYWRLGMLVGKGGIIRFLPVPLLLLVALLAKENAIVLVPVLLLMEVLWFQCRGPGGETIKWLQSVSYALIIGGAVTMLSILLFGYETLAARFSGRSYTLDERLLSQSRIVSDYIGQLFAPEVWRMGLYHDDFHLSRSLFDPMVTLYAVLAWSGLLLACVVLVRWQAGRWLVFGIAWFVLGHSVESTVLPLELYFEHRNYFPAIGIALLLGAIFAAVVKRWPEPRTPLLVCLGMCVVILSAQTSSQVQVWSNRSLLILHHLNAHPESVRANIDMAVEMASLGEVEAAHHYSQAAFEASAGEASVAERRGDYEIRDLALSCIANKPSDPASIDKLGRENPNRPLSSVTTLLSMVRLLQDNKCPQFDRIRFADRLAEIYLVDDFKHRASSKIYSNLAVLENALQRYDNALAYVERFLALSPNNPRGLLMKLQFAIALGRVDMADEIVADLQELDQKDRLTVAEQQTLALYLEK